MNNSTYRFPPKGPSRPQRDDQSSLPQLPSNLLLGSSEDGLSGDGSSLLHHRNLGGGGFHSRGLAQNPPIFDNPLAHPSDLPGYGGRSSSRHVGPQVSGSAYSSITLSQHPPSQSMSRGRGLRDLESSLHPLPPLDTSLFRSSNTVSSSLGPASRQSSNSDLPNVPPFGSSLRSRKIGPAPLALTGRHGADFGVSSSYTSDLSMDSTMDVPSGFPALPTRHKACEFETKTFANVVYF